MPPAESAGFRRVLFYGRPADALLAHLSGDRVGARAFDADSFRLAEDEIGVVLFDRSLAGALSEPPPPELGLAAERCGLLLSGEEPGSADAFWTARILFSLPEDAPESHRVRAVRSIFRVLEDRAVSARARRALTERSQEIRALVDVGIALSAERDPEKLLELILTQARTLTQADAGSLYLVESSDGRDRLRFAAAQNDSVRFEFREATLPLDGPSVAAHVARSGLVVNLIDVARLPEDAPYRFDADFDRKHGYRTRTMLAVPMQTPQGRTIGVLQLLNRKVRVAPEGGVTAVIRVEVAPFTEKSTDLARSLAAQAAVAVENRRLTERVRALFEDFVGASVTAIEQRDPTTAGHSERVAALAVALAEAADRADGGPYADFRIGREELRELRYAAVLHDFGKVGVREEVLGKARKLPPGIRELVRSRVDQAILSASAEIWERALREGLREGQVARRLSERWAELERAWEIVVRADEPTVLAQEAGADVARIAAMSYRDAAGRERPLITPEEAGLLAIPQGSLSEDERREIESHVTETYRFLSRIPWTEDLSRVADWAYAHHEKLDGSGYPRGLAGPRLPAPVRMLTIADIYDALAARDRPYKRAVPPEKALDILRAQARGGRIDADLLDLFIGARVYEASAAPGRAEAPDHPG
ncbi:MAG TPA: HD domain-containing phosphohydrolase [Thermoanaerobaculia bacterium]|nr:HD domain-containing phosphohydrolase [Thermoanaerobaculia bacterium]